MDDKVIKGKRKTNIYFCYTKLFIFFSSFCIIWIFFISLGIEKFSRKKGKTIFSWSDHNEANEKGQEPLD